MFIERTLAFPDFFLKLLNQQHEKDFWAEYDQNGDALEIEEDEWDLDEDGDCAL